MLYHVLAYSPLFFLGESGSEDLISKAVSKELAPGILEYTRKCKVHRLENLRDKT